GAQLESITLPTPSPVPLAPTFTEHNGYFLIGSNQEVVKNALTASKEKNGLLATPEFMGVAQGLSMTNNGLSFVSARFQTEIAKFQESLMEAAKAEDEGEAMMPMQLVQKI